ncbi:MAG TPA: discoidin domain-containing protein [Polyangia bacterium]
MTGKPGPIDVMTTGTAGKPANEGDAGNEGTLPRRQPGAAGARGDTTGAGGSKPDPTDASAGATGAAGTGAAGTGGSAGAAGATGQTGVAGAAATDAGAPEVVPVSTNPCDRATWTFVASVVCTTACASLADSLKLPANAIDGDAATRYTTGIGQGSKGPEVVILNFPKPVTLTGINLLSKNGDGPVGYVVEHSLDGANFLYFSSGAAGVGSDNLTVTFPATRMLALRITQTGVKPTNWWSIHELTVLGCAQAP